MENNRCPNCGSRLTPEDVGSCPNCGSPIRTTPAAPAPAHEETPVAEEPPAHEEPHEVEAPPVPQTPRLGKRSTRARRWKRR